MTEEGAGEEGEGDEGYLCGGRSVRSARKLFWKRRVRGVGGAADASLSLLSPSLPSPWVLDRCDGTVRLRVEVWDREENGGESVVS